MFRMKRYSPRSKKCPKTTSVSSTRYTTWRISMTTICCPRCLPFHTSMWRESWHLRTGIVLRRRTSSKRHRLQQSNLHIRWSKLTHQSTISLLWHQARNLWSTIKKEVEKTRLSKTVQNLLSYNSHSQIEPLRCRCPKMLPLQALLQRRQVTVSRPCVSEIRSNLQPKMISQKRLQWPRKLLATLKRNPKL